MFPTNGLPEVANGNAMADPAAMLRQIEELAICVDEITTQTALNSLTAILEAAAGQGSEATARAAAVASDMAEGATALETHIRRLLAAAAGL